ncbi:MAG TPA: type II toxin-antitoxin system VapC family toxin [Geobacteraceae bacterium]
MRFWDASAIIPLCIDEPKTEVVRELAESDGSMAVWWGTVTECHSAFARVRREGGVTNDEEDLLRELLSMLARGWMEIEPSEEIRSIAGRLLLNHPLRAADSLQLAAALVWAGNSPKGHHFVCLDQRLREAARKEGFLLIPS